MSMIASMKASTYHVSLQLLDNCWGPLLQLGICEYELQTEAEAEAFSMNMSNEYEYACKYEGQQKNLVSLQFCTTCGAPLQLNICEYEYEYECECQ